MKLIVAVDKNWGIGYQNKLLLSIPEDMKFFRKMTMEQVVVMGRKTLESFPNGKPLKNRINVVLTRDREYTAEGAIIVHSTEELYSVLKSYHQDSIYVIGGDSIYHLLLDSCDIAYITRINQEFQADAWFPNLEEDPDWILADAGEPLEDNGIFYRFQRYEKKGEND